MKGVVQKTWARIVHSPVSLQGKMVSVWGRVQNVYGYGPEQGGLRGEDSAWFILWSLLPDTPPGTQQGLRQC